MTRLLRLTLAVFGLALALYGTSTLTGGWLGMAPWWDAPPEPEIGVAIDYYVDGSDKVDLAGFVESPTPTSNRREWISGAVIAVGVGLVACGAWPRRQASPQAS